jgi:hypothetical protein
LFIEVFLARCNQIDSLPYHIDVAEKLFLECILLFADYRRMFIKYNNLTDLEKYV